MTDTVKTQETTVAATDWLASRPVFYNEATGKVSSNINEVIDFGNLEFHPEGLRNYLAFGYSVFEQTPVRHVKFLRHSSRLIRGSDGKLNVICEDDPVLPWVERRTREEDVIELLASHVNDWEDSNNGDICVPTSGGYDSRLLNILVRGKARIRSFSYGISGRQEQSYEVVYARELAKRLGTRWEQIPLGCFHRYFDEWERRFGVSTHAHGMYHIEFFRMIRERHPCLVHLLSGIIGDAWAGSVVVPDIRSPDDVYEIGYTHGIHADPTRSRLPREQALLERFFEDHRTLLQSPLFRIVQAMRFKLILLSYLLIVPESLGFKPWSPFLIPEVALSMLALPPERRHGRAWQRDLFEHHGVDFEDMSFRVSRENSLDMQGLRKVPVPPLCEETLREIIVPAYVRWVNRVVCRHPLLCEWLERALSVPRVNGICRRLGISDRRLEAYFAYVTLRPLETLLRWRNASQAAVDSCGDHLRTRAHVYMLPPHVQL